MAEVAPPPAVRWGCAARTRPGEAASGDAAVVRTVASGTLLAVVDGLGHGHEAARASAVAAGVLRAMAGGPLPALLRDCHRALADTRGAAIGLAFLPARAADLTWLAVGRVHAAVLSADGSGPRRERWLPAARGVAGHALPGLRPERLALEYGDVLVMVTDGVREDFTERLVLTGSPHDVAARVIERGWTRTDDAVALVLRHLETSP